MKTADGKFEILEYQRDDDSYMYSSTSYDWRVVSVETGDELASFSGSDDANSSGSQSSGTASVSFSAAGDAAIAIDADRTETRVPLPASMRTIGNGAKVEITWRDGRVERRRRAPVLVFSKYGQVFDRPLVDPPPPKPVPTNTPKRKRAAKKAAKKAALERKKG